MDLTDQFMHSASPMLVPNSVYSLADLRNRNAFNPNKLIQPFSAPPIKNNNNNKARNNENTFDTSNSRDRDQFFFGRDFSFAFQNSPILHGTRGGENAVASSSFKRANSSDTLNDISDQLETVLTLRQLMSEEPPMSAPPLTTGIGNTLQGSRQIRSIFTGGRTLPQFKAPQPEHFSLKVFLGGIPTDLTSDILQLNFTKFGKNFIDWPKKTPIQDRPPHGYAFVVFENEQSIFKMLHFCQTSKGRLCFPIYTISNLMCPIEVKVWEMKNTTYASQIGWRKFRRFSVFVGGIPRTCTAIQLAYAIEEVLGPVAYCTIELDSQHHYPKGAACVVFTTKDAYIKALAAHDVMLTFGSTERKVEFKAFLASNMPCEKCEMTNGTRFCNEKVCLAYYCHNCWKLIHQSRPSMSGHVPSKRQSRGSCSGSSK